MSDWRDRLKQFGHKAEEHFDKLKYELEERLGSRKPIQIVPYNGYGTPDEFWLKGRVLKDKGIRAAEDKDTVWDNLLRMYKHFESDEVPGVMVRAQFQNIIQDVETDEEGYFDFHFRLSEPLKTEDIWHEVRLDLIREENETQVFATGSVIVPPKECQFGVISDIDDTIIRTGVTNLLEMVQNTFLRNAMTRLPFEGVDTFYHALRNDTAGKPINPIFYVSHSPWNLYDFLCDFMNLNNIPKGPVLLRDLGIDEDKFIKDDTHKFRQIQNLLNIYPELPFILIGDSGEKDPEIYYQIVQDFPGRIQAIYIRDVTSDIRDAEVKKIANRVSEHGVEMMLVEETKTAAKHAVAKGWIS